MKNKRLLTLLGSICLILVLAALPFMAACAAPTPPPVTPPPVTPPPVTPPPVTPPPPSGPQYGGILRISATRSFLRLGYPPTMVGTMDGEGISPCIEPLFGFDKTGEPVPRLATAWKADPIAKTYTLTLRQGVKFHDGSDFNAEVVKWNLDNYRLCAKTELKKVQSIDVIDDYTVRLNLSEWDSLIVSNLALDPGRMISKKAFEAHGQEWCEKNPVGTGPFKFVSYEPGVLLKLERFDDYWQKGKPYLDGIERVFIVDLMTRLAAFKAGEIDIITFLPEEEAAKMEEEGKYKIVSTVYEAYRTLQPDSAHSDSPFADIRVRQAIEYAIDKEAICKGIGYGYWVPLYQVARPGSWGENPNLVKRRYDPEKAKQLLAEAHYPNGFKMTLFVANFDPKDITAMVSVQNYLAEVGITAEIRLMEAALYNMMSDEGGWQNGMFLNIWMLRSDEIKTLQRQIKPAPGVLATMFYPIEVIDAYNQAEKAADFETKKALTQQMEKLAFDKYCMETPLYVKMCVSGKSLKVHDDNYWEIPEDWTPADAWIEK